MKKAGICVVLAVVLLMVLGCGKGQADASSEMAEGKPEKPPVLRLHDALSSTLDKFEVMPGGYTWYVRGEVGGEMTGVVACGPGPLDETRRDDRLSLPRYNRLDQVPYSLSWDVMPDSMAVTEYNDSDMEHPDAVPVSNVMMDDVSFIDLVPGRVYEITAEWKEENQESRGFYGTADYVVVTE